MILMTGVHADLPTPFRGAGDHIAVDLGGAQALFTTCRGGNLGTTVGPQSADVLANRRALADSLGVTLAFAHQVHGTRVMTGDAHPASPEQADGQATTVTGVAATVMVADCLPVAVAGDGGVAMVHAGWRGLAGGIVGAGVERLRALGVSGPLSAAIGPGAGPCCYEVGDEVHRAFSGHGAAVRRGANVDLKAIATRELERAGVEHIHDLGLCTICSDPTLFFSHRRDRGVTGRQAGLAWLR
ncbi:MAG: purine-nucleoside/S-methyl-5-thioadenosine phosphorylase / adenosine deaminase [Solirubrobacteraceae bacterium]|nr:purine-nucleoside/S-methyl-5-thioadenosine phosphorylase / adenosine deaminase [Solirubrobacteraceae bacterium]